MNALRIWHLFIAAALTLPALSFADYHFQKNVTDEVSSADQALATEITEFLAEYEAAYNNQDYRKVKSMWLQDGNPIYMAEEVPFPLYGKSRMDNYFNPRPGKRILDGIDNKYSNVRAKYVAPGIAVATYRLDYDIKIIGMEPNHSWDRIMAVFTKDNEGNWKLTAYAEAPMGPATMVRKMMQEFPAETEQQKADYATTKNIIKSLIEAGVSPGFDEFLAERTDLEPTH